MITCTAYGPAGPAVYLATTEDFTSVERHGIVRHPEDKNAALLPERIDGKWILFHRPKTEFGGAHGEILLSRSADLESWSAPEQVLQTARGRVVGLEPDRDRPTAAAHRARLARDLPRRQGDGRRQRLPGRARTVRPRRADPLLHRLPEWILGPLAPYERSGDVPNTVFPCGLVHDAASDEVRLYYGAADTTICLATALLDDLLAAVLAAPTS